MPTKKRRKKRLCRPAKPKPVPAELPAATPEPDVLSFADVLKQMAVAVALSPPLPDLDELPLVPPDVRELVLDRIDAAYRDGFITLDCENYAALLMAIMPDDFVIPAAPEAPTDTCPRSAERMAVYAARCRDGVRLYHDRDAQADTLTRSVRVRKDGGTVPRVEGWHEAIAT